MAHLTARACNSARPRLGPKGKPEQTAYPDDDPVGLELRVSGEGKKTWTYRYRTLDGQQRRVTLGVFVADDAVEALAKDGDYEPLTLKNARKRARALRAVVEVGGDPAAVKIARKTAARAELLKTLNDLAAAYFAACETGRQRPRAKPKRAGTLREERALVRRYLAAGIGQLRLEDLTKVGVRRVFADMIDRGLSASAVRVHSLLRCILGFGVREDRLTVNVAQQVGQPAEVKARHRVLNDAELKALWALCEAWPADLRMPATEGEEQGKLVWFGRPTRIAVQLALLLTARRSEIVNMQVAELNLGEAIWNLPPERNKTDVSRVIPLPPRAVELIEEALALAGQGRDDPPTAVFPGRFKGSLAADNLSQAVPCALKASGFESASPHDLRRTAATVMASERLSVPPHVISLVLGHAGVEGGAATTFKHYAKHTYLPEKRKALCDWETLLLKIVGEGRAAPPRGGLELVGPLHGSEDEA
jgi:integrase